jgi:hypothetical protein
MISIGQSLISMNRDGDPISDWFDGSLQRHTHGSVSNQDQR